MCARAATQVEGQQQYSVLSLRSPHSVRRLKSFGRAMFIIFGNINMLWAKELLVPCMLLSIAEI